MRTTRLPSPNRAGRAGPVALLMALAVLATGCFRVDVRTEVNEDGSGTVEWAGIAASSGKDTASRAKRRWGMSVLPQFRAFTRPARPVRS